MRIKIVLCTGLALMAVALVLVLLHSPLTIAATNGVQPARLLFYAKRKAAVCQAGEAVPAGTSAIRLQLTATTGPRVTIQVLHGTRPVTSGTQGTGWYGSVVTIPVAPVRVALRHTRVCFQLTSVNGYVTAYGTPTSAADAATASGRTLPGRMTISYLRPSAHSWLSQAGAVIEHMGLGRAASGTWIVLPIVTLLAAAIALASWVLARELR